MPSKGFFLSHLAREKPVLFRISSPKKSRFTQPNIASKVTVLAIVFHSDLSFPSSEVNSCCKSVYPKQLLLVVSQVS